MKLVGKSREKGMRARGAGNQLCCGHPGACGDTASCRAGLCIFFG